MTTNRRLAAILAADVVGYSRLMGADEAGTLLALKALRSEIIDPKIAEFKGRVFKTTGDGVLAEFPSIVNAVSCAVEIQRTMDGRPLQLRIGVHLGDVIVEADDIFGDGVNLAARVEGVAPPGGVALSALAFEHVGNRLALAFDDIGEHSLKNIDRPVRVYCVRLDGETALSPPKTPPRRSDKPSIAVLPFVNMSGDIEQQYFSDGITEDIITELSRFRSLFVIARNSSFQFREKAVDVRRVALELGVHYVVEGSVRKMGNRIRITAQLIDAATGNHMWSERYDREIADLFAVQDEVTRTIVATLIGRVEDAEIKGSSRKPTISLAAYDSLLRGVAHLRGYSQDDNRLGRELFEQAVSLDPDFALAHAHLAIALLAEHRYDNAPVSVKQQALASAQTAVRLDPLDSRCQTFLGQAYRYCQDFDLALKHCQRALTLNPNDANGLAQMGYALAVVGRGDEGIALVREAMLLNPFHPDWYWDDLAIAQYATRRYEDALHSCRQPSAKTSWRAARAAACLAQLGRMDDAHRQVGEVLRLKPDFRLSTQKISYKNPSDAEHVYDGMRKAGLPE